MPIATTPDRYAASTAAHARAVKVMPGGVNSPVRAYRAVGRDPITIKSGSGCRVTDVDGNTYIDYVLSYGPLILGHAAEPIQTALAKQLNRGWTFGMPTEAETRLAETVVEAVPGIDVVRFVNSGTEAAMSAIRLARAATGRSKLIKCLGNYHGHSDALLVSAGSGATTLGTPSSPGVPQDVISHTLLVPYNDLDAVEKTLRENPGEIAAMCVEPIAGNMGCIPPEDGYLLGLRELCDQHDTPLLFDEVMTGFRVAFGGAQELYGVTPDLVCLGKVVGGGLPCAAYGGRADLMRQVSPDGPVYQAGTLSGNPLAMAAGQATLDELADADQAHYADLEVQSEKLAEGLIQAAADADCAVTVTRVGSMLGVFFTTTAGQPVRNYADATACRTDRYTAFFNAMLDHGVILAPSAYEAWFLSTAHDDHAIAETLAAAAIAFTAAAQIA
ncbi:MAG: glutamate-1-semialdehyde 2,1-aminomutase [Planctomycetota bacterium]